MWREEGSLIPVFVVIWIVSRQWSGWVDSLGKLAYGW